MHRTNIEIDEKLMKEALRLTGLKSKKEVVHHALQDLVRRRKQRGLLTLKGRVTWEGDLNEMRRSRT